MKRSYAQTAKQKESETNPIESSGNGKTPTGNPWQKQPQIGTSVKVSEQKPELPAPQAPPQNASLHGQKKIQNYPNHHQQHQQYFAYPQYPADYNQYQQQYYYQPTQFNQQSNQPPAFQLPTANKVKIKIVNPLSQEEFKLPTPVKVSIKAPSSAAAPVMKNTETGQVIITPSKPVSIKPPPADSSTHSVSDSSVSIPNSIAAKEDLRPAKAATNSAPQKQSKSPVKGQPQAIVETETQPADDVKSSTHVLQKPAVVLKPTYAQPSKKPVEEAKTKTPIVATKPAVQETTALKADKPAVALPAVEKIERPASPSKSASGPPGLAQPVSEKYTVKKASSDSLEDGQVVEYLPDVPLLSKFDGITYPASVNKKPFLEGKEIKYPVEFLMMFHETIVAKPMKMMAWKDIYGEEGNRHSQVRMSRQSSDRGRGRGGQRGRGGDRGSDRVGMSRQHSNNARSGQGNMPPKGGRNNRGHATAIHAAPLVKGENAWDPKKIQLDESAAALKVIKGLLNKLTMDTFAKLSTKIIESNITNEDTLAGMIAMISEKAIDEPHFASMYAMLCQKLYVELPSVHTWVCPAEGAQHNIFRKLLLKRCQAEFEKDARWKAADDEAQAARKELRKRIEELSAEEKNQIAEEDYQRGKLKRRVLGNMVFIGELYRQTLISEAVIHRCLKSLLTELENPEEEDIESLCKLLTSAGRNLDHQRAETLMNQYFERIDIIINSANISSRIKFLLMDVVDLRLNKWIPKSGVISKPKTIAQVHKEIQLEEKSKLLAQRQGSKNVKKLTKQSQQPQHQDVRKITQKNDGEWTSTRQAWGSAGAKSRPTTGSNSEQTPTAKLSNAYGALDADQSVEKPAPAPSKSQAEIMGEALKNYRESLEASELLEDLQDVEDDEVVVSLVKNIAQFLLDKNGTQALKIIFLLKKLFFADEDSESSIPSYSPDLLVLGFKQFLETFEDDRSDFPKGFFNISQVLNPLFAEKYISMDQLLEISEPVAGYSGRKPALPDFLADFLKASQDSPFKFIAETEFNIKPFFPDDEKLMANVKSWSKMKSLNPITLFSEVLTVVTRDCVFGGDFSTEASDDPAKMKIVFETLKPSLLNYKQEVLDPWNLDAVQILVDTQNLLLEYNFTHYADSLFHILYGGDFFDREAFLTFKNEHGASELADSLRKWEKKVTA